MLYPSGVRLVDTNPEAIPGQVPGTQHFRIVFLPPEEILEEAYGKIGEFYAKWRNE